MWTFADFADKKLSINSYSTDKCLVADKKLTVFEIVEGNCLVAAIGFHFDEQLSTALGVTKIKVFAKSPFSSLIPIHRQSEILVIAAKLR